jgi:DMSO/TMAO reductase YedYZ molybdopterin-dependent catalytic subunit
MRKIKLFFVLTVLVSLTLIGCSDTTDNQSVDGVSAATKNRYRESEIQEYEGARLDPAVGPRDNSINGVQIVNIDDYQLKLTGLVDNAIDLEYDEIRALDTYARKITLYCVEGWDATILWEGVLLKDIMDLAGVNPNANTVIFHAVDGYTTSLPLKTILDNGLILAYSANGLDLPPEMGYPFIVVAENKLGYKWARWVSEIELSDDPSYRGYWESRGYKNDADV